MLPTVESQKLEKAYKDYLQNKPSLVGDFFDTIESFKKMFYFKIEHLSHIILNNHRSLNGYGF